MDVAGLAVGNIHQGHDDIPQSRQTLVDTASLLDQQTVGHDNTQLYRTDKIYHIINFFTPTVGVRNASDTELITYNVQCVFLASEASSCNFS